MLIYNEYAFRELRTILYRQGTLRADTDEELRAYMASLDKKLDISEPTFYNWFQNQKIPFCRLILMCNLMRFPLAFFFRWTEHDDAPAYGKPNFNYRIVPEAEWKPIHTSLHYMISDMQVRCHLSRKEIGNIYGIKSTYKGFAENDLEKLESVTLERLITYLQDNRLTPSVYFYDENEIFPSGRDYNTSYRVREDSYLSQLDFLREENEALQHTIDDMFEEQQRFQDTISDQGSYIQTLTAKVQELTTARTNSLKKEKELLVENARLKQQIHEQHKYRKRNK